MKLGIWTRYLHNTTTVSYEVWVEILGYTAQRVRVRPLPQRKDELFETQANSAQPLKPWYAQGYKPSWYSGADYMDFDALARLRVAREQYPIGDFVRCVPPDRVRLATAVEIAGRVATRMDPNFKAAA